MSEKYFHMALIFKGMNLNYGEGVGNILSLKKLSCDGKMYSYASRQAIRYDIVRMLKETHGYEYAGVDKESGVVQFSAASTIQDFPEIDFFGYMKTKDGNKIRKAVVRLTDAVSLEPFANDLEFGTNKGLADRIADSKGNEIFQAETHKSFYCYTLTCDLEKIGKDDIYDIDLPCDEKAIRLQALMNVIKLLYRDIRGKRENLSPLFVIGGLYESGNPFFYNRIKLRFRKDHVELDEQMLNDVMKIRMMEKTVGEQTAVGSITGAFGNVNTIQAATICDIEDFFGNLNHRISAFYNG